jgi:hypothetical protein
VYRHVSTSGTNTWGKTTDASASVWGHVQEGETTVERNIILFGWNRSIPGREKTSATHFQEFVGYLEGLQREGTIQGFDAVFLDPHGGDLNGFFLIRGESPKLDTLVADSEWSDQMTRAILHLEGAGAIRGSTGDQAMARMELWKKHMPG